MVRTRSRATPNILHLPLLYTMPNLPLLPLFLLLYSHLPTRLHCHPYRFPFPHRHICRSLHTHLCCHHPQLSPPLFVGPVNGHRVFQPNKQLYLATPPPLSLSTSSQSPTLMSTPTVIPNAPAYRGVTITTDRSQPKIGPIGCE
ncbi:hypothetical protein GOBAR_DD08126 [Gossypium barbadense]|nr:hypothetical protein GOBAR_DD08126 [Gossypium barbadense]